MAKFLFPGLQNIKSQAKIKLQIFKSWSTLSIILKEKSNKIVLHETFHKPEL